MMLVLIGPPGVGKGTQASRLEGALGVPQISTGDLLRAAHRDGSSLGHEAAVFMDAGELVPDALVVSLIEERLAQSDAQRGGILDGFPRTVAQAQSLQGILQGQGRSLKRALLLTVDEDTVIDRILGRRICPSCHAVFHVSAQPPRRANNCDGCGTRLESRIDDTELAIRTRLANYRASTEPVIEFYRSHGVLREVDGGQSMDDVFIGLQRALNQ